MHEPKVHPATISKTLAAKILYEKREEVLSEWVNRVRIEVKSAENLLNPVLTNTIPLFIERLAESLCAECSRETATESSNSAQEHGGERARITRYGPEQIIQEYQLLQEVIRRKIIEATPLHSNESDIIQKSFDKALQEAMISFFLVHGRIREQFVASLTHDLRNPIGAVKLAAELMEEILSENTANDANKELTELSHRVLKNARRADRMIQNMLDASVVQVGERLAVNLSLGNLQDIVIEAIGERPIQERKRIVTELTSITGFWDVDALQRSIENLISNAFKYGEASTPITISIKESHERVMISVHNYGNPIPAENLESLFQVFRRAEAAKKGSVKGWGIGLALARSTAERMGGSLEADSSLEQGTTFTIDIPNDARPFQD